MRTPSCRDGRNKPRPRRRHAQRWRQALSSGRLSSLWQSLARPFVAVKHSSFRHDNTGVWLQLLNETLEGEAYEERRQVLARLADGGRPTSVGRPSANYTEVHASIQIAVTGPLARSWLLLLALFQTSRFSLRARQLGMPSGAQTVAASVSCSGADRQQLPPPQRRQRRPTPCCLPSSANEPCTPLQQQPASLPRRGLLAALAAALGDAALPWPASASKLPAAVDRAWEGLGGGPADLVFPGGLG